MNNKNTDLIVLFETAILDTYRHSLGDCLALGIPCSDVISQVKDITYGFIDKNTGERRDDRDWIHNCPNLSDYYETNFDPEVTLKNKLGICLDQSIAIKHLFSRLHPDYECKIMALTKGRFGHAVPIFRHPGDESGKEWYYLENAWDKERGLHGGFRTEDELRDYLDKIYHKHHDKDNDDPVIVQTYEEYAGLTESENLKFSNVTAMTMERLKSTLDSFFKDGRVSLRRKSEVMVDIENEDYVNRSYGDLVYLGHIDETKYSSKINLYIDTENLEIVWLATADIFVDKEWRTYKFNGRAGRVTNADNIIKDFNRKFIDKKESE